MAALIGAIAVAALWTSARAPARLPEPPSGSEGLALARSAERRAAPDFALPDLEGRRVRLRDFRGRAVLLNFWATWCPPCLRELPALEAVSREHADDGLVVLAVSHGESPETVRGFVEERRLRLPVLLDEDGSIAQRYRVVGLPTTILVDREGAIAASVVGYRDWNAPAVRASLSELVAGRR